MSNLQNNPAQESNKAMSRAFKEVQEYRDMMNQGRERILADDLSSCVYIYNNNAGFPCVIAYRGRAKKPAFCYYYKNVEDRDNKVSEWMKIQSERKSVRRKAQERALSVGDVLRASWGYEQTNIDYYMVTGLIGKTMVELVEIGQHSEQSELYMQGRCTPDKSNIVGKLMRRRADGINVNIDKVRYASKIEPEIIDGQEVYSPDHWSSYA